MIDEEEKTPGKIIDFHNSLVIFVVLNDEHIIQVLSNIGQVRERGATIIVISCVENLEKQIDTSRIHHLIELQPTKSIFAAL